MRFKRQLYASKSPEETLRLIADFRNLKAWDDSVQSVVVRDDIFAQGSQYDVRVVFSGNPIAQQGDTHGSGAPYLVR